MVVVFVVVLVVKLVEVVVGFAVVVLVVELVKVVVGFAVVLVVELVKVVVSFVVSLTAALSEVTVSPEETVVSPAVVAVVVIVVPEVVASADFPPNAFSIVFPSCAHQTALSTSTWAEMSSGRLSVLRPPDRIAALVAIQCCGNCSVGECGFFTN